MKKKLALAITVIMALSAVPAYAGVPAAPTASKVTVNGEAKAFEAYNIKSNNYFKLRDIAYVLNGTDSSFSVGWDGEANSIALVKGEAYAPTGSEMKVSGTKDIKDAVESNSTILIDGQKAALKAYTIKGNNYFKLRDLGTALGFDVGWDNASQTISITSAFLGGYGGPGEDYVPEESETPVVPEKPSKPEKPIESAKPNVLTEEQLTEMGLFDYAYRAGLYNTEMTVILAFPKTSDFADIKIESYYLNGKENTATAVKLPGGESSFYWDDSLTEYALKYFFNNGDLNTNFDPVTGIASNDYVLNMLITMKDGTTYHYTETGQLKFTGFGGDTSWGDDQLSPELKSLQAKLLKESRGF